MCVPKQYVTVSKKGIYFLVDAIFLQVYAAGLRGRKRTFAQSDFDRAGVLSYSRSKNCSYSWRNWKRMKKLSWILCGVSLALISAAALPAQKTDTSTSLREYANPPAVRPVDTVFMEDMTWLE